MPTRSVRSRSRAGQQAARSRGRSDSPSMNSLHDLFEEQLKDLYSAE